MCFKIVLLKKFFFPSYIKENVYYFVLRKSLIFLVNISGNGGS